MPKHSAKSKDLLILVGQMDRHRADPDIQLLANKGCLILWTISLLEIVRIVSTVSVSVYAGSLNCQRIRAPDTHEW